MTRRLSTPVLAAFLFACISAHAQLSTWKIDPKHTQIDFQIRRVPVSNVRGSFSRITGVINWNEKDPSKSSVQVTIPTSSISTANEPRDTNLR